jgi:hypothetical protein
LAEEVRVLVQIQRTAQSIADSTSLKLDGSPALSHHLRTLGDTQELLGRCHTHPGFASQLKLPELKQHNLCLEGDIIFIISGISRSALCSRERLFLSSKEIV